MLNLSTDWDKEPKEGREWLTLMLLLKTLHQFNSIMLLSGYLQINYDLSDASQNGYKVKNIPCIPKIVLRRLKGEFQQFQKGISNSGSVFSYQKTEGHNLKDALDGEDDSESCVQVLQDSLVCRWGRVILKINKIRHRGVTGKVQL